MLRLPSQNLGLLPLGLTLSSKELEVILCFKEADYICYPDTNLTQKEVMLALSTLKAKQLIVRRQYYQLTKRGKKIKCLLFAKPENLAFQETPE